MPEGYCILFLARIGAFYSKLYDLKKHPYYADLYESWEGNTEKLYDHYTELKYEENSNYTMLCECGLNFAKPIIPPKIEKVDQEEIRNILKTGIIRLEDLKTELVSNLVNGG